MNETEQHLIRQEFKQYFCQLLVQMALARKCVDDFTQVTATHTQARKESKDFYDFDLDGSDSYEEKAQRQEKSGASRRPENTKSLLKKN